MKLTVEHRTLYHFDRPMRGIVQSHRLWPSRFDGQTVVDWKVTVDGGTRGAGFRDGAGDWVDTVTVRGPVDAFAVVVAGTVETKDLTGVLRGHREGVVPEVYLRDTRATRADASLGKLANGAIRASGAGNALDRAHALSDAVRDAIDYRPGETDAGTSAAEALAAGMGVCQDHAHALIGAARHVGIPARYVTGYLHTASGEGEEASHAWAELFVSDLGWVGFDASNRVCPDARYIRLGSGFDALDAAPIRGVATGQGAERLEVDVSVAEAGQ